MERAPNTLPKTMTAYGVGVGRGVGRGRGESAVKEGKQQQYIPGLNQPPPSMPVYDDAKSKQKDIPEELIKSFLNESKHPVSAVMEYAAIAKLDVSFEEAPVEQPSISRVFAVVCRINGRPFPQGAGKTKKDAKTEAARIAFKTLITPASSVLSDIAGFVYLVIN